MTSKPGEPVAGGLDRSRRGVQLFAARQQRGAVPQRPAVILDMRDLQPLGADLDRERDHRVEPREVMPMDDRVEGQRQSGVAHRLRGATLFRLCARPMRDPVAGELVGVLQTQLNVLDPGLVASAATRARSRPMPEVIRLP